MTNDTTENSRFDTTVLHPLGWSGFFDRQLAAMNATSGSIARVISAQRGRFLVMDGSTEGLFTPAGRLLHGPDRDYPVTGDWVLTRNGVITAVVPRRTLLSRGDAGTRGGRAQAAPRQQGIGANLDTVFIVYGLDRDYNLRRLERYLTLVHACGLDPVIVLTKADLHPAPEVCGLEVETIALGVPVVLSSVADGRGCDELESHLGPGRTVAMVGSSGAGKSTLANLLLGSDAQATGAVSQTLGKGRHTTTVRELLRMPQGGLLMDNPGIREIAFHEHGHGMDSAFADIGGLAGQCRFADCSHQREPGCAVRQAVETGELALERLESYHKMRREMDYLAERSVKSAGRVEKERWQDISKRQKGMKKRKR